MTLSARGQGPGEHSELDSDINVKSACSYGLSACVPQHSHGQGDGIGELGSEEPSKGRPECAPTSRGPRDKTAVNQGVGPRQTPNLPDVSSRTSSPQNGGREVSIVGRPV